MSKAKIPFLEQIDKLLIETKYGEPLIIPYGDFSVTVKTTLTEMEKKIFINRVVENSYINNIDYSPIDEKITFVATFAQMLTSLPIPTKLDDSESVDTDKLYAIVDGLNLIDNARLTNKFIDRLLNELEMCINQEIAFKNQKLVTLNTSSQNSNEAIETVSLLANRVLDGVNKVCDILDNVKDLSKDGKLLKVIPKKKLDYIFSGIQKLIDGVLSNFAGVPKDNKPQNAIIDNIIKFKTEDSNG